MLKRLFLLIFPFLLNEIAQAQEKTHFVSFIIPCYNCQRTVEESIASIYDQHLEFPFEVICTNDGSTDETESVLIKCSQEHSNLFVYSHEYNRGGGAARNTCVQHSRGDLIFCLDSDNILCPNSVGLLIDLLDEKQSDIAAFAELRLFRTTLSSCGSYHLSGVDHFYDIHHWLERPERDPSSGGNYLFTRESYDRTGGYWEDLGAVDTHSFGYKQLATGSVIHVLPNSFYWHRLDDNSYFLREERKNTNNINMGRALLRVSEIFSEETQENVLQDPIRMISDFHEKKLKLASPEILESLFKAYVFRQEKNYQAAAAEFERAIQLGCTSEKIRQYLQEMLAIRLLT